MMMPNTHLTMKEQMADMMIEIEEIYVITMGYGRTSMMHIEQMKNWQNQDYAKNLIVIEANRTIDYINPALDRLEILDMSHRKMCIKAIRAGGVIDRNNSIRILEMIDDLVDIILEVEENLIN